MNNKTLQNDNFLYESSKEKSIVDLLNLALFDKKLISFITGIGVFFTIIVSTIPKKVWEGKFQMVIRENPSVFIRQDTSVFNDQETLQILKSTSVLKPVLMPVFEEINKTKEIDSLGKDIAFFDWLEDSLEISRGSKLLNVKYKDNNKDNIIPIIKIISNKYKQYFKNNKKEFLKNSENYLNQQIIKFNQKTVRSLKKVQDFADKNKLKGITILRDLNIAVTLQEKEEIQKFMSIISDNSLIDEEKETKDVIFEYRELLGDYFKNKNILIDFEKRKREFDFNNSISLETVEIITEPLLISASRTPSRFVILIFGSMFSLLLGILFSLYKNRNKSNFISDKSEIKNLLNLPLLEEINLGEKEYSSESLKLFIEFNLSPNDSLGIIPVGNIDQEYINKFLEQLNSFFKNAELISPNKLSKANKFSHQILIIAKNRCNENDLQKLKYKLKYFGKKVIGWILLEDNI